MIKPSSILSDYLVGYNVFEEDTKKEDYYQPLPNSYPELFFHYGDPMRNSVMKTEQRFFIGFDTKVIDDVRLNNEAPIKYISTIIQPYAALKALGIQLYNVVHNIIDLELFLGDKIDKLIGLMNETKSDKEKVGILEKELEIIVQNNVPIIDPAFKQIINYIHNTGIANSEKLAEKVLLSKKTINRRFQNNLGISLKDYLRIVRFNRAFRMFDKNPHIDVNDVVVLCNYYDKSHFYKEFKYFTKKTPTEIFEKKDYFLHNRIYLKVE